MSGTDLELAHAAALPTPQGGALPTALEWQSLERMATMLAGSGLVPYRLRGKAADVAVILLAAREYGIPPLMALSKLPVVNGTPAPMGELMVALVLRAGHKITVKVYNGDGTPLAGGDTITPATYAECISRRVGDDEDDALRFTMAEAVTAELVEFRDGKPYARSVKMRNGSPVMKDGEPVLEVLPWEQYTVNMLRWRAVANTCRLRFPDVLLGLSYLPEELGATVDAEGAPIVTTAAERGEGRPPAPSLEERTAAETLDRALRERDPEVLKRVAAWVEEHQLGGIVVTVPVELRADLKVDASHPLAEVLAAIIDYVAEGNGAVIMDTADSTPQEAAEAPPAPQQPQGGTDAPPGPEQPAETPTAAPPDPSDPEVRAGILRAAAGALLEADPEVLVRTFTRGRELALLDVDVAEILTDDDRDAIDVRDAVVPLGRLLMAVGTYVRKHGTAVKDAVQRAEDLRDAAWPDPDQAYPL